jgi:N-acetylmuramoyl-L-alanine amidase
MASFVQQEVKTRGRAGRGVKQAGFLVLYKTFMPSILIETGFLSNDKEEKYLASVKGQDEIAHSIFKAFQQYKSSVETMKDNEDPIDTPAKKPVEEKTVQADKEQQQAPEVKDTNPENTRDSVIIPARSKDDESAEDNLLQWSVQFYTAPKAIPDNSKVYSAFDDVREDYENGIYKYSTGLLPTKAEAIKLQTKIRQMGYKDAFVVAIFNNKKISVKEAMQKSQTK